MSRPAWQQSLTAFFAERAGTVASVPTLEDLCFVSGRDFRLWSQPGLYEDLIADILAALDADASSDVLEVGCASGFLARGVAPIVRRYVGVDLAKGALAVARRLKLPNAEFRRADGARLPFLDDQFDGAFCYDVFTNFPQFADGAGIITEMLRVIRPGGNVLVGSIPDASTRAEYELKTAEVARELERAHGAVRMRAGRSTRTLVERVSRWFARTPKPEIACFYFAADDFRGLGERLGLPVEIVPIHSANPYVGYRFNAVYRKPVA